jgi:hypothetical protein
MLRGEVKELRMRIAMQSRALVAVAMLMEDRTIEISMEHVLSIDPRTELETGFDEDRKMFWVRAHAPQEIVSAIVDSVQGV